MTIAQAIATHLLAAWIGAAIGVVSMAFLVGAKNDR